MKGAGFMEDHLNVLEKDPRKEFTNEETSASKDDEICGKILEYGKGILNSDVFRRTSAQTHHLHSTLFDHTINVCVMSILLSSKLEKRGEKVNEKDLVQAALCHDLGMVSRDSKYKGTLDSWKRHPQESARIARTLVPDMSRETEEMILSHMWPVSGPRPDTKEGRLLCIADKYASMADWKSFLTRHRFAERIKERLEQ